MTLSWFFNRYFSYRNVLGCQKILL